MEVELYLAPGRILVEKVTEDESVTDGGIIILRGTKTSLVKAKVWKVGQDLPERKMGVKPGDWIYFRKGNELDVEFNGIEYWMLDWNAYLMYERQVS